MGKLYLAPGWFLTAGVMLTAVTILLQTVGIVYGFRRLQPHGRLLAENLFEMSVLFHLITILLLLAEVNRNLAVGFVRPGGHLLLRSVSFLILAVLGGTVAFRRRAIWPVVSPVAAALTLPAAEQAAGTAFPVIFLTVMIFWMLRCTHFLLLRTQEHRNNLTALSIKEAVDTMDAGLLFCNAEGAADGQILLQNTRMQDLMLCMTGSLQFSGKEFYEALLSENVLPGCRREKMGSQLAYRLPDDRVWVFDLHKMAFGRHKRILLSANDTTQRWEATQQLWQQNAQLEQSNGELQQVLEHLEAICKNEEMIRAKSRVHDVLGQRISLLLRAMREHRRPDETLLEDFAEGLPKELTQAGAVPAYSLSTLTEVFRGIGVEVCVEGTLPQQENTARAFFEISEEAVTNAVRHGYASRVDIRIGSTPREWTLCITDNGIPPAQPVTEGGGIGGMRRRIRALGGDFSYSSTPHFEIRAAVLKGEEL